MIRRGAGAQSGGCRIRPAMTPQDWALAPDGAAPLRDARHAARRLMTGIGAYLPDRAVSNAELAQTVDTSDSWIVERTGIRQRYLAAPARNRLLHGHARGRGRAGPGRRRGRRGRCGDRGDLHARPGVSRRGRAGAARAGHDPWLCLRRGRGVQRLRLRAVHGGEFYPRRHREIGAGDRQRGLFAHPELAGPHHLRAVR